MAGIKRPPSTVTDVRSAPSINGAPAKRFRDDDNDDDDDDDRPTKDDDGTTEASLLQGMKKLARRQAERSLSGSNARITKHTVDQSRTTVVPPRHEQSPSRSNGVRGPVYDDERITESDDEEDEDDDDQDAMHVGTEATGTGLVRATTTNRHRPDHGGGPITGAMAADDGRRIEGEPTLGERLAMTSSEPVDVEAVLDQLPAPSPSAMIRPAGGAGTVPSANSLGTVLTQALRTDDVQLLESCLQTSDRPAIRATIQRLPSPLATTLLSRLADRMHRRPARAGELTIWVQWTLVAHGGYLANQPHLIRQLSALHHVLDARARGLQPLLALKGKLDMLEAQLELRRVVQPSRPAKPDDDTAIDHPPDDREGIIYVEEDDDDVDPTSTRPEPDVDMADAGDDDDDDDDDDDSYFSHGMPTTNGHPVEFEDEPNGPSEPSDDDDLIDDEAEETDADSDEEMDDDDDDDDDDDIGRSSLADEVSDVNGQPALKRSRSSRPTIFSST